MRVGFRKCHFEEDVRSFDSGSTVNERSQVEMRSTTGILYILADLLELSRYCYCKRSLDVEHNVLSHMPASRALFF